MKHITYGYYNSLFGKMVIGRTDKGLCWLGFMGGGTKGDGFVRMKAFFAGAEFTRDDRAIDALAGQILDAWEQGRESDIPLDLQGTPFQVSVWKALLKIPRGAVKTYGDVANDIGSKRASRAVGSAVGSNPVSLIVPCHRVVPQAGGVGNYLWGSALKEKLLAREAL